MNRIRGGIGQIPGYPPKCVSTRPRYYGGSAARQSITVANLTTNSSTTNASSYATASITTVSGRLYVIDVVAAKGTANPPIVQGVSGAGLTFTHVDRQSYSASLIRGLERWYAIAGSSSSGALTIDYTGYSCTSAIWSVNELAGINTSSPIRQTVKTSGSSVLTLTTTLAALEHANNYHLCAVALDTFATVLPSTGFTELGDDNEASANITMETEGLVNTLACSPTWAIASAGQISSEIVAG